MSLVLIVKQNVTFVLICKQNTLSKDSNECSFSSSAHLQLWSTGQVDQWIPDFNRSKDLGVATLPFLVRISYSKDSKFLTVKTPIGIFDCQKS